MTPKGAAGRFGVALGKGGNCREDLGQEGDGKREKGWAGEVGGILR